MTATPDAPLWPLVVAVDFDGTLSLDAPYPEIGRPNAQLIDYLRQGAERGHILILWTCREGRLLDEALMACAEWDLPLYGANVNYHERTEHYGYDSRKIGADWYIDDRIVGLDTESLARWHKTVTEAA